MSLQAHKKINSFLSDKKIENQKESDQKFIKIESKKNIDVIGKNLIEFNTELQSNFDKPKLDFEFENRLVGIISLYGKGLTQYEIATHLGINQSTVSRDLKYLREGAREKIWDYLNKEILFEYMRYIVTNNDINKRLWKIIDDTESPIKEKTNALVLLNEINRDRIEILMKAPESYFLLKKNISEIKDHDKIQSNPILKFNKEVSDSNNIVFQKLKLNTTNPDRR